MNLLTQIKHKTQKGEEVVMDIGAKASNVLPENFVEQQERSNLAAKDKLPVIFGKLSKWYTDLKAVAWSGSYSDLTNKPTIPEGSAANYQVANNDTTEAEGFVADARIVRTHGLEIDGLSRDFAGGQMEIRLTEAGKGEYRKKGADTWIPFRSEIRIINIFLPPHRDNWGHMDIDVSDYSTLSIGSVTTSGGHTAEIMGDDVLIGSYKHGDKNIILNISDVKKLRFRNSLKTTDFSRYVDFGNVTIS